MSGSTRVIRQRFWRQLAERGRGRGFLNGAQELPEGLYWAPVGARIRTGIRFSYTVWKNRQETAVELYICCDRDEAKRIFDSLEQKKLHIEQSFGGALVWNRLTSQKASRVRSLLRHGGLDEERKWPMIHEEMISAMDRLVKAVQPYL